MNSYQIKAQSVAGGSAKAEANHSEVSFDASSSRKENLPNPAELLLTSLAACMLKNVERFSELLKYEYETAEVEVNGIRSESPPFMEEINYTLKIKSNMEEKKLNLLHKNILKFGTITNTIARGSKLNGTIEFL